MRLLRTNPHATGRLTLVERTPKQMIGLRYAILSHVWEEDEILFEDIIYGSVQNGRETSRKKVYNACERAARDGHQYIWIDTCCIDKRSSAELSEAINSMFAWYRDAVACYAYLNDAPDDLSTEEGSAKFSRSKWFRRGWTLQELLAPKDVEFFSGNWTPIGEKKTLSNLLAKITGIDREILLGEMPLSSASIARRMSWAAKREVTRPEDIAYSLMGVFSVNMPMLYGEGAERAFLRLQEEIMRESDDQSLFAWISQLSSPDERFGLLAPSTSNFLYSNSIISYEDFEPRSPYTMTNRGLRIELHLTALGDGQYVAAVDCPPPPNFENSCFLAIYLEKLSDCDEQYARVKVGTFAMVRQRGPLQTIYIRQKPHTQSNNGAFPQHVLQLRNLPPSDVYKLVHIFELPHKEKTITPLSTTVRTDPQLLSGHPITFPMSRGADQLSVAIIFERVDKERIVVLLGSLQNFQVGFGARELDVEADPRNMSFKDLQRRYKPSTPGSIKLEYHNVRVSAIARAKPPSKYYIIDIGIESVKRSTRFAEMLLEVYDVATGSDTLGAISRTPGQLREQASDLSAAQLEKGNELSHKKSSLWSRLKR
ncbi:HET-domain-containing protein [Xylaria cf. heliscus]|nr:HET-domain-containing protein [Xylaria cf. heliscus]